MVIPAILTMHRVEKNNELVKKLQKEARMLFYDKMMYEINDSLTSILAVCDEEARGSIPKIKQCINRINLSLNNTKKYQDDFDDDKKFDIHLVIKNLIRLIKEGNKEIGLTYSLAEIKAPASGDHFKFEELFLHIFVDMFAKLSSGDSDIIIELRQKDKNASVTILNDSYVISKETIDEINKIKSENGFEGSIQINPQGRGKEISILIPLLFKVVTIKKVDRKVGQIAKI